MNRLLLKVLMICTLALTITISMCSLAFAEDNVVADGTCGDDVTWVLTGEAGDMTLTISGTGQMSEFTSASQPWMDWKNDITSVIIGDEITSIGNYAFYQLSGLTSVDIPESVITIGENAFGHCTNISSINLHEGLVSIGKTAFSGGAYTQVDIPNSVTSMGHAAFSTSTLKDVTMPLDMLSDFGNTFWICESLNVTFTPGTMTVINENAGFKSSKKFESVTFPKGVTKIGENAFQSNTYIKEVYLPNTITEIGKSAFSQCSNLKYVEVNKGVRNIGAAAFWACKKLESINLPDTLLSIEKSAFADCITLDSVHIPSKLSKIEASVFNNCNSIKVIDIPSGVKSIGGSAFYGCGNLMSLIIPSSVEEFGNNAVANTDILYIYCEEGSAAEQYAINGGFKYDLNTGHKFEEENIIDEQAATCTEDGTLLYYCPTCRRNVEEVIPANHDWDEPTYTWSADNKTVTATRTCKKDDGHKETETVNTTAKVTKKATYTAKGQTTYTAIFENSAFETQSKTVTDIPQLAKKANTLTVKAKTNTVKFTKLKKKNQTIRVKKAFTVSKARGKVTYKKVSGNKKILINSAGKVTVKKGLKKGKYKVKVKVTAAGNTTYKAGAKTVTLTIKVK